MPIIPYYNEISVGEGQVAYTTDTNLPTPTEVRNRWCFGLPLTSDSGFRMPDEDLMGFIKEGIALVERYLGIYLKPTLIAANPEERELVKGVDYEKEEAPYDYDVRAWLNYGFLQLRQRPVRQVTGLKLVLPNGNIIMDFMQRPQWIKLYKDNGQLQLVPYGGDPTIFALLGGSQAGYPFVTGMMNTNLPQMIYVDYVAGYDLYEIPNDVRNMVAKIAAVQALGIAGDAIMAGISSQSTSIDGLSESFSTSASATSGTYSSHIKQMQGEIDDFFDPRKGGARTSERGFTMTGL